MGSRTWYQRGQYAGQGRGSISDSRRRVEQVDRRVGPANGVPRLGAASRPCNEDRNCVLRQTSKGGLASMAYAQLWLSDSGAGTMGAAYISGLLRRDRRINAVVHPNGSRASGACRSARPRGNQFNGCMNIIFFSHPSFLGSQSMPRFVAMLVAGMQRRGFRVDVLEPAPFFYRIPLPSPMRKWLGYIDQYLMF